MPHFLASEIDKVDFPKVSNGFEFQEIFTSSGESLISTLYQNKKFFLRQILKNGNIMVKGDQYTRPAPVSILKNAIKAYWEVSNAKVTFENLSDKKIQKQDDKFKDIKYFLNDFKFEDDIFIEVGFGSGRHLLAQAKANPNVTLIGLEIHTPSIEKVLRQIHLENINNVLVLNYDARLFLELVESNSINKIFVHFPVPWDKKEHRRVYSKEFISEASRALKVGGRLELRTDSPNYYEYVKGLFLDMNINIDIKKNEETIVSSKYEDRWKKQKKDIYDMIFTNQNQDEKLDLDYDFSFDELKSFHEIKELSKKPMIFDGFVIHFQDFYTFDDSKGLVKLSFGDFNKIEHQYIFVDGCNSAYYQDLPVPSKKLFLAHKKLNEILKK
jgi:tRNA (guanine-N7-)-methyltransferase